MDNEIKTWFFKEQPISGMLDYESDGFKDFMCKKFVDYFFCRTCEMFEWSGDFPTKEIPQYVLESHIQRGGFTGIIKVDDKFYSVYGGLGGERNYNYLPTKLIVANPYLKINSNEFEIDKECVIIQNDAYYMGLSFIHRMYASELVESKLSRRIASINMRAANVFTASDDDTELSINNFVKNLIKGKVVSIMDNAFLKNATTLPYTDNSSRTLTQLIENEQYIKASWYNEIGIQANYNMKRESINSNEAQLNKDALLPLCQHMLDMRRHACDKLKEVFGLNVSVDFSSSWKAMAESVMSQNEDKEEEKSESDEKSNRLDSEKETENKEDKE